MMKKVFCVAVLAAWCVAPAWGQSLELRVVEAITTNAVVSNPGATVDVEIQGRLTGAGQQGLALWGVNLTTNGSTQTGIDLCTLLPLDTPAGDLDMEEFKVNKGLNNPAGYGGTCNGAGGLWQIGGGQNTINNTGPTPYPSGTVVTGVADGAWKTLAEGTFDVSAFSSDIVLALDTGFANSLDLPGTGPVWNVTEVANITLTNLLITYGIPCPPSDVNNDGQTNGGDLLIVKDPSNWLCPNPGTASCGGPFVGGPGNDPANWDADVNADGTVSGGDLLVIKDPANWLLPNPAVPCNP